jgi:hypothetical protein
VIPYCLKVSEVAWERGAGDVVYTRERVDIGAMLC